MGNPLGGKSEGPPEAPNYQQAAQQTSQGNLDLARLNTKANRVNQYTPWGNQVYTMNPDDTWNLDVSLSPDQQRMFDIQNQASVGLGQQMQTNFGQPMDQSSLPAMPTTADTAGRDAMTSALMERMQPSLDRQRQQTENQLLIQGHNRGGDAWNAKQTDLNQAENDARLNAVMAGGQEQSRQFGLGSQARQQAMQEQDYYRNAPLNQLNALRGGMQTSVPQFNTPMQQGVAGPDYLGAVSALGNYNQGIYNAQQGSRNNKNSGIAQIGGGLLSNPNLFG